MIPLLHRLKQRLHWRTSMGALFAVLLFCFLPLAANANVAVDFSGAALGGVLTVFGNIILWFAQFIGKLIALMLSVLQVVLQYNEFIRHPVVEKGWEITRDLANTGFVALMLIIAFGTMFGVSKVNWQRNIPRLFIAAIAVNFSRLITGLFIDFGQVIMIAFVNALQQVGFGNFIALFKLSESQAITGGQAAFDGFAAFAAAAFAFVTVLITLIVIGIIVAVLVYRIVILWVLIIMSPIAFIAGAASDILGQAGAIYSNWWGKLTAAVTIGPVLSFFLWLALATVSQGLSITSPGTGGTDSFLANALGSTEQFTGFIIAIALLMAGLEIGMQSAGQLGGLAEKAVKAGSGLARQVAAAPGQIAIAGGLRLGRKTLGNAVDVTRPYAGAAVDRFRNYRETAPGWRGGASREELRDRREGRAQELVQQGGMSAVRGRAQLAQIQQEKDLIAKRKEEASKRVGGLEDGRSTADAVAEINRLDGSKSTDDLVRAGNLARDIVGDEARFASLRRQDPVGAAKLLKQAKKHAKDMGDEAGQKKINDVLDRNIAWGGETAESMADRLSNMTEVEKRKLSAANWESAAFREAARSSGFVEELLDPQRNKGYARAATEAASRANDPANRQRDTLEQARYNAENDIIAQGQRDGSMDNDEATRRRASNNAINRLQNGVVSNNMGDLLQAGAIKLEDIDLNTLREGLTNAAGVFDQAAYDARLTELQEALVQAMSSGAAGNTLQRLKDSASDQNELPQQRARAEEVLNLMSGPAFARAVNQQVVQGNAARATVDRNDAMLRSSVANYNYNIATGTFDSEESRRRFTAAVYNEPTMILNMDDEIEANNGSDDIVAAIASVTDKDMLKGMMKKLDASVGTDQEDINRRTLQRMGDVLQRYQQMLSEQETATRRTGGTVSEAQQAARRGVDDALRHYQRRIQTQIQ